MQQKTDELFNERLFLKPPRRGAGKLNRLLKLLHVRKYRLTIASMRIRRRLLPILRAIGRRIEQVGGVLSTGYAALRRAGTPGLLAVTVPVLFVGTVGALMISTAPRNLAMDHLLNPPPLQLEYLLNATDSDTALPPETNEPLKMPSVTIPDALRVINYHVKAGDTISGIAQTYGVSDETIISFNGVDDARLLRPDTVLKIPTMNGILYRVRPGDTLQHIASSHNVSLQAVESVNHLIGTVVLPNEELFLPGAHMNTYAYRKAVGTLFVWPTRGVITSRFGMRHDPFTHTVEYHAGVDIANSIGTAVDAAMDGRVIAVGRDRGYGNYILIQNGGGYRTLYAHLLTQRVSVGQWVRTGQEIGRMGDTGYSTGPHLHFGIFKNGVPVNPLIYLQ